MKNKLNVAFSILVYFTISTLIVYAQPKISKEKIPSDIHSEVKKQIERLYSSDPVERGYGAYYLGEMGENAISAIPFLIGMLYDSPPLAARYVWQTNWWKTSPGQEAAEAVVKIDKSAVNLLLNTLKNKDPNVRMNAILALGEIRNVQAVEPLISALKDKDPGVRTRAAEALMKIPDNRAVEPLIIALKDEYPGVRMNAALAMGGINDKRLVEPLISVLNDNVMLVRRYAAMSLINIGDSRAVEPLIKLLNDEDSNTRVCAASALGKIKDKRAVEPLIALLNNKEGRLTTKGGQEDMGSVQRIEAGWHTPSGSDSNARGSAALALGEIGGAEAINALVKALRDSDFVVSANAVLALEKITKQTFGPQPITEEVIKKWEEWWQENKEKFGKEK
jgi:HEAT repeat protein